MRPAPESVPPPSSIINQPAEVLGMVRPELSMDLSALVLSIVGGVVAVGCGSAGGVTVATGAGGAGAGVTGAGGAGAGVSGAEVTPAFAEVVVSGTD
jgi:hypothetical protein